MDELRDALRALEMAGSGGNPNPVEHIIFSAPSFEIQKETNIHLVKYFIYLLLRNDYTNGRGSVEVLRRLSNLEISNVYPGIVTWAVEKFLVTKNLEYIGVWESWLVSISELSGSDLEGTVTAFRILLPHMRLVGENGGYIGKFISRLVGSAPCILSVLLDADALEFIPTSIDRFPSDFSATALVDKIKKRLKTIEFPNNVYDPDDFISAYIPNPAKLLINRLNLQAGETCGFFRSIFSAFNPAIPLKIGSAVPQDAIDLFALGFAISKRFVLSNRKNLFIHKSLCLVVILSVSEIKIIQRLGLDLIQQFAEFHPCSPQELIRMKSESIIDSLIIYIEKNDVNLEPLSRIVEILVVESEICANVLIDLVRVILKRFKPRNFPLWALQGLHSMLKNSLRPALESSKIEQDNQSLGPSEIMAIEIISRTKYCIDIELDCVENNRKSILERSVMATIVCMEAVRTLKRSHEIQIVKICEILNLFNASLTAPDTCMSELDIRLVAAIELIIFIAESDPRVIDFFRDRINSEIVSRVAERVNSLGDTNVDTVSQYTTAINRLVRTDSRILSVQHHALLSLFLSLRALQS